MYEPMEVLKLKDVVEELEAAADAFEHVAHTVQTIAVKEPDAWRPSLIVASSSSSRFGFDYTNGFHDAANAIATSVSTRALTPRVALAMAGRHELRRRVPRAGRSPRPSATSSSCGGAARTAWSSSSPRSSARSSGTS